MIVLCLVTIVAFATGMFIGWHFAWRAMRVAWRRNPHLFRLMAQKRFQKRRRRKVKL